MNARAEGHLFETSECVQKLERKIDGFKFNQDNIVQMFHKQQEQLDDQLRNFNELREQESVLRESTLKSLHLSIKDLSSSMK